MTPPKVLGAPKTLVIRHDQQHVGRALRRYDAWGSPGPRLRSLLLDHPAEFRSGGRKLFSINRGGGTGRTWDTCDLLSQCRDATKAENTGYRHKEVTGFHDRNSNELSCFASVPHLKAEHMAAPTNAANVKKALANSEPSTHGRRRTFGTREVNKKPERCRGIGFWLVPLYEAPTVNRLIRSPCTLHWSRTRNVLRQFRR
jgi:hypothetical protein